ERLYGRKAGGPHGGLEPSVVPELDLGREQGFDGLSPGKGAGIEAREDGGDRLQGAGHLEVGKQAADAVPARRCSAFHLAPPAARAADAEGGMRSTSTRVSVVSLRWTR